MLLILEIDMPGHSSILALLSVAAYGLEGETLDLTINFLIIIIN